MSAPRRQRAVEALWPTLTALVEKASDKERMPSGDRSLATCPGRSGAGEGWCRCSGGVGQSYRSVAGRCVVNDDARTRRVSWRPRSRGGGVVIIAVAARV